MGKIFSRNKIDIDNMDNVVDIDICAICLNNVTKTNKNTTMLECNHFYHTECIDVWLSNSNFCPCCMQQTAYKPVTKEPKLETKTVINIIQNNIQNNVQNNIRNKKNIIFEYCSSKKESYYVFLAMFVIIANIINIALLTAIVQNINNNYISDIGDIGDNNTTECIKINQKETNINIMPDYFVQSFYTFYLFILPGLFHTIKNKYIYVTIITISFIISYALNIYRFVMFNKYLDLMEEINFCDSINYNIQIEKLFLLIEIIILGISLPIYMIFNISEYFHRKKVDN
jgi:hypothetical protein